MFPFSRQRRFVPRATPRDRVLSEWRGIDLAPLEKAARNRVRSAHEVMPQVLGTMRMDRRQAEAELVKVWNSVLDPNITAHAQPAGIRKGTLFVTVDSNVWLAEIVRYRRREILDRLQHSFGRQMVQKISYRVG